MSEQRGRLVLERWRRPEEAWMLCGWEPKDGKLFVVDPSKSQRVLTLTRPAGAKQAFSEALPVAIVEVRLMPPPCRTNALEAEALRANKNPENHSGLHGLSTVLGIYGQPWPFTAGSDWERIRLEYDKEVLVPVPEDDPRLAEQLGRFKEESEKELAARRRELSNLLQGIPVLYGTGYYPNLQRSQTRQSVEFLVKQEQLRLDSDFTQGVLKWTLREARQWPAVRNVVLRSSWAREVGLDLGKMTETRVSLCRARSWLPSPISPVLEANPWLERMAHASALPWKSEEVPEDFGLKTLDQLALCARVRFLVKFEGGESAWLANFTSRLPQNASERQQFQGEVSGKLDQVLSGVNALVAIGGDRSAEREVWPENPLSSRESIADYLLTMEAAGIKGGRAAALVYFGYGETREKCAKIAGVSVESIKRDLTRARKTPYGNFFRRKRKQGLEALSSLKNPAEAFAWIKRMAEDDPDKLRAVIDQVITRAQSSADPSNVWDSTVEGLS